MRLEEDDVSGFLNHFLKRDVAKEVLESKFVENSQFCFRALEETRV
jgi:heme oxygenase